MPNQELIKLFEAQKIRVVWDEEKEKYFFSIVDCISVLNDSDYQTARKYWKVLKGRLLKEGFESVTNCYQLKMRAYDGKQRLTDVADKERLFRIIQSVPSKKAEPFKQWLAAVGAERIRQMEDPERSLQQMVDDYRRMGYSENWINQRIKTIEIRKGLTDEWKRGGVQQDGEYALLTDLMSKVWSGMTTGEYKRHKGLTTQNLRDNMTNMELLLNALAEQTATDISKAQIAQEGAERDSTAFCMR